jgi:hypothetical protein
MAVRLATGRTAAELIDSLTRTQEVKGARWNP